MPRWLCASQWELTRRRRPSYRAGGRRARCPAPRPIGRARRGRRAPIGRGANNGARPLKGAGERRHCGDELGPASARRAQRGAEPRPSPRATSAPAASAPPLPPCEAAGGSEGGGSSCRACGGEIIRVKNKNNNSNAGEPALPSPTPLPRSRRWSRGSPVPSVPR